MSLTNLGFGTSAYNLVCLVGPPGFEPGSDDPQPPSIGQANPRALLCLIAGLLTERSNLMNEV